MTVDALRKSGRTRSADDGEALAIGEADANIFECPSCSRPLAVGTRRCPGCGTRLLAGVRAVKAAGFIAAGLMVGLVVGGGTAAGALLLTRPFDQVTAGPIVAPSAGPLTSAVPTTAPIPSAVAPTVDPAIPASAISALRQSALLNQRLVDDGARLAAALAVREPVSVDIARALRALASSAAFGDRIGPDIAAWPAAAEVSASLTAFYAAIGATAREGLSASLTNTGAYVAAGSDMLAVLQTLTRIDAAARDLAASADIELPPLTEAAPAAAP